jgi:hypothetical protein
MSLRARRLRRPGNEWEAEVVIYITTEGLKTLDAIRDRFRMEGIEPTLEHHEERRQGAEKALLQPRA